MTLEKEFKRANGKKVKIKATLYVQSCRDEFEYSCQVFYCEPRKRTWKLHWRRRVEVNGSLLEMDGQVFVKWDGKKRPDSMHVSQVEPV